MNTIYAKTIKAILVATTIAFSLGTAQTTLAVEYGGIGGKPAYPREDNARTESIFVHTLEPGQVQAEGVLVLNNTGETKTIAVYAVDGLTSTDGAFGCHQLSDPLVGVGTWIALEQSEVTLESATNTTIPFTITVPEDADVGEQNGCIVIEEQTPALATEAGVHLSFRSAIRVAVTVPGDIVRQLNIANFQTTRARFVDVPDVEVAVGNTGNVSLDADVEVITKDIFGRTVVEHGGIYPILRDQTADWSFELVRPFWGGLYQSQLNISYDGDALAALGEASGADATVFTETTSWFVVVPSLYGGLIEGGTLVVLLTLIVCVVTMQRRKRAMLATWVKYTTKEHDTIKALAEEHKVDWKLLAKANHLSAPYHIAKGDELLVPPATKQAKVIKDQSAKDDDIEAQAKKTQPAKRGKKAAR